jgi:hypothetical protein
VIIQYVVSEFILLIAGGIINCPKQFFEHDSQLKKVVFQGDVARRGSDSKICDAKLVRIAYESVGGSVGYENITGVKVPVHDVLSCHVIEEFEHGLKEKCNEGDRNIALLARNEFPECGTFNILRNKNNTVDVIN